MKAFFLAPNNGNYTFSLSADDKAEVYIDSANPNSNDHSNM
jgi:hypothetical protein